MRKLIEQLNKWYIRNVDDVPPYELNKWQRDIILNFVIDYCKEVTKKNG